MTKGDWRRWLLAARGDRWPSRVSELMPPEIASTGVVLANYPSAEHPLDAEGHLSLERLDAVLETLATLDCPEWMVAWWDGWKGISDQLKNLFGDRLFSIDLPERRHLAGHTTLETLRSFSHAQMPFIGPSLLAAADRSALLVSDVDWGTTYLGFSTEAVRDSVVAVLERHGVAVTPTDSQTPLPGFGDTSQAAAHKPVP